MTVTQASPTVPESAGRTFVCYARQDETFVTSIASGLRARGIAVWIDQSDIEPGADWSKAIDAALNACTAFLIVLSPAAIRSDEVRGELRVALNQRKRIIPLLYRPCEIPRQLLLRQYIDFTRVTEPNDASIDRLAQALRDHARDDDSLPADRDDSSRSTLLEDVSVEVRARLQTIGIDTLLPIRLEPQPHQVERPWDPEVGVPPTPRPAPPVTDILELFDDEDIGGRLLILGAPGSGKTTVLLQLLRALVDRAVADASRPVPVLLSLVSWKNDKPIGEWLIDEMHAKHGVRPELGVRWRNAHRIAILLDGLDELPPDLQQPCVQALNEFDRADRPPCLVVCCRQAEYENFTVKLRLWGAVSLKPLEETAVRGYLARAARPELWSAIQADPDLIDMARSPLLLSFMLGLGDGPEAQRWQNAPSVAERRQRLFDSYVLSLARADTNRSIYTQEQTLRWLHQLASMLQRQGNSEFLIEQMQPHWIESPWQRWAYRAGVFALSTVIVGIVFYSSMTLFNLVPHGTVSLALITKMREAVREGGSLGQLLLWLIAIVVAAVVASRRTIVPIETLTWSWSAAWRGFRHWGQTAAFAGLDYGVAAAVVASLIWNLMGLDYASIASTSQTAGSFCGTMASVVAAVYFASLRPSSWLPYIRRPSFTPRWIEALGVSVLFALVVLALSWIGAVLSGLALFAILAFSVWSIDRARVAIVGGLTTGTIGGAAIALISGPVLAPAVPFVPWLMAWLAGGLAIGTIVGMAAGLTVFVGRRREQVSSTMDVTSPASLSWKRWRAFAAIGGAAGVALGVIAAAAIYFGFGAAVRSLAVFVWWIQVSFVVNLSLMLLAAIGGAIFGTVTAGVLGALGGALGGATGADVERRLVPNQGIRQSAVNVVIFAALGAVIVGVPYGLFNLTIAAVTVGALPSPADWLRLGLGAGISFGLLAGLVPGAACIQHLVLRTVLWAGGTLPLRYAAFLDFATQRRLLQRVGGRYRFIHVLLRDYLGDGHATTGALQTSAPYVR